MKRPKTLFGALVALALALSVSVAVPVYAADVQITKEVTPLEPNVYNLTDTIHYVMSIINLSDEENVRVEAVWDVLPDGLAANLTGPLPPYILAPGENATYTCDWVATGRGRVVNTFHASGYQITTPLNATFNEAVEKSSLVMGHEVGGTASLVNKVRLVAPWAVLLACAAVVTLLVLRKRRHA